MKLKLFIFAFFLTALTVSAQETLVVKHKNSGETYRFPKSLVDNVSEEDGNINVRVAYPLSNVNKVTFKDDHNPIADDYFEVEGGDTEYETDDMPNPNSGESVDADGNNEALPGGTVQLDLSYRDRIACFYISVEGTPGHYVIVPDEEVYDMSRYIYKITLMFSQNFKRDICLRISAKTVSGVILSPITKCISYHKAGTGALQVSLSFSNAKDVDLHVYTPSGQHIFYGNRGGTFVNNLGQAVNWGLDVDSNAGCHIDNINNENIFFPEEMLENGTYSVYVNMYSNCNPQIATDWTVVANRGGVRLTNLIAGRGNPTSGTYSVGAGSGDMTLVMKFDISKDGRTAKPALDKKLFVPTPLSDMDKMKLETDETDYESREK